VEESLSHPDVPSSNSLIVFAVNRAIGRCIYHSTIGPSIASSRPTRPVVFPRILLSAGPFEGGSQIDGTSHSIIEGGDPQSGYRQMQCLIKSPILKQTRTRFVVLPTNSVDVIRVSGAF
jgi:hypothetical protein